MREQKNAPARLQTPGAGHPSPENGVTSNMITARAIRAKHETPRCVAIIVKHGRDVITERLAPHLRVVREEGKPATVVPLRDVRPAFDGPNPQRVADVPPGAA